MGYTKSLPRQQVIMRPPYRAMRGMRGLGDWAPNPSCGALQPVTSFYAQYPDATDADAQWQIALNAYIQCNNLMSQDPTVPANWTLVQCRGTNGITAPCYTDTTGAFWIVGTQPELRSVAANGWPTYTAPSGLTYYPVGGCSSCAPAANGVVLSSPVVAASSPLPSGLTASQAAAQIQQTFPTAPASAISSAVQQAVPSATQAQITAAVNAAVAAAVSAMAPTVSAAAVSAAVASSPSSSPAQIAAAVTPSSSSAGAVPAVSSSSSSSSATPSTCLQLFGAQDTCMGPVGMLTAAAGAGLLLLIVLLGGNR